MEQDKIVIKNKEEIITKTMDQFYEMSNEEQKLLLFVLITSYIECLEGIKNSKNEEEKSHWFYQKETYDFILRLFTKPPKELQKQGYNPREFIFKQAKKDYDKLFNKECEA